MYDTYICFPFREMCDCSNMYIFVFDFQTFKKQNKKITLNSWIDVF